MNFLISAAEIRKFIGTNAKKRKSCKKDNSAQENNAQSKKIETNILSELTLNDNNLRVCYL